MQPIFAVLIRRAEQFGCRLNRIQINRRQAASLLRSFLRLDIAGGALTFYQEELVAWIGADGDRMGVKETLRLIKLNYPRH